MFQLSNEEWESLISQFAISNKGRGGRRKLPYAFTEHGVLMLSSVLNSKQAIHVNIHIMRVYTRLRELLLAHKDVFIRMEQFEKQMIKPLSPPLFHNNILTIADAIRYTVPADVSIFCAVFFVRIFLRKDAGFVIRIKIIEYE